MPKKELYHSVDRWSLEARILLVSLVLSEPVITRRESREIVHLLRSARWIETFTRRHPWKVKKRSIKGTRSKEPK